MKQLRVGLIVMAVAGGAWYGVRTFLPVGASKDFALICAAYERGMAKLQQAESSGQEPNEAQIAFEIANEIEKGVVNRDVMKSVQAVSYASNEDKYDLLQQAASELGVGNWECEAFRAYNARALPGST